MDDCLAKLAAADSIAKIANFSIGFERKLVAEDSFTITILPTIAMLLPLPLYSLNDLGELRHMRHFVACEVGGLRENCLLAELVMPTGAPPIVRW